MTVYNKRKEDEQLAAQNEDMQSQGIPLHTMDELDGQEDQPMEDATYVTEESTERIGRIGKIGKEEVSKAVETLLDYKKGKTALESRIVSNEEWYKMRHWEEIRTTNAKITGDPEPSSAWLLNSILNKHADAMDNFPEPSVLPREEADKTDAKQLSAILPVILEQNDYESTYSDKWWYKLKTGTGVEGIFWNQKKNNGLGDIDIRKIDLLNIFWEPGIMDIQKSRNFFNLELVDNELLTQQYDFLKNVVGTSGIDIAKYTHDDTIDTSKKSVVVDWYYKLQVDDREVLHYCKFVNGEVLYASENDPDYADRGYYDHAKYPFVFDTMFVEEGTPAGFGYIDIMKDAQLYIDKLNQVIIKNALMAGKKRWFVRGDGSVNEEEFADWSKTFVHVPGGLGEQDIREIVTAPLPEIYVAIMNQKIEELKETSGNRDFSQGGTASGVTAASAIAALQEAGSKLSRDMIKSSYRSFTKTCYISLELIRQFYTEPRCFRIVGEQSAQEFVEYDNARITEQDQGSAFGLDQAYRLPIFDIKVRSQKSNPFSKIAQNEMAKEFYGLGFFNPEFADQSLAAIEMMDFEGKEAVKQRIAQNGTLLQQMQQLQQQMAQMAQIIDAQNGTTISQGVAAGAQQGGKPAPADSGKGSQMETNSLGNASTVSQGSTASSARQRTANASIPQ